MFSFLCILKQKKISEWSENFWNFFFFKSRLVNFQKKKFQKFSDHSEFFFCFTIHKKLNKSCYLDKKKLFLKKKVVSLKKTSFEILWSEVRKGGFQFLWKMVLWGATYNAVVVVGVVSLLLFRLPMAILCIRTGLLKTWFWKPGIQLLISRLEGDWWSPKKSDVINPITW